MASENYWPENLLNDIPTTPTDVLSEVAAELGEKTRNLVVAEVQAHGAFEGEIIVSLNLRVPVLDGYKYQLLQLSHDELLYPVSTEEGDRLANEQELREYARRTLGSEKTARIIKALVAQAKNAPEPPPF